MNNCLLTDDQLAAYSDGTLSEGEREGAERHLAGCARCRGELDWLHTLAAQSKALPREIAPERELWSGIAGRMDGSNVVNTIRRRRFSFSPLALAAAAVALIALSVVATLLLVQHPAAPIAQQPPAPGVMNAGTNAEAAALVKLVGEVREFERSLPPGTRALVAENLKLIDAAIAESERALAGQPGNAAVTRMLEARYQQRLELLEQAARAAPES
ncbi:MAG TPA: zf-HC2 domain-containing protein [Gemmatimonadales bacterium]|nr:zf-HC2 domain-containing protein [Gemmatimonadales bacterium]